MKPLTIPIRLSDWAFIPGPEPMDEPTDSQLVQKIAEHTAESIAATILSFPGTKVIHAADPSWWEWKAEWRDNDRFIALTMTLFNNEETEVHWGGSMIEAECLAGDIIALWSFLQTKHEGVWLHADCTMHTQRSFLEAVTIEAEQDEIARRKGRKLAI